MGGKSQGQPGAYGQPNPFMDNMRELMKGAMTNLGPGFWGPQNMPNFGPAPSAAAAAAPAALAATSPSPAPAAPAASGSVTTTPDTSAGATMAAAVTGDSQPTTKKTPASAVVTQT